MRLTTQMLLQTHNGCTDVDFLRRFSYHPGQTREEKLKDALRIKSRLQLMLVEQPEL